MRWRVPAIILLVGVLVHDPLLAGQTPPPAPPLTGPLTEREVTIANRSALAISSIHISPTTLDAWGQDRLGDATLEPGRNLRLRLGRMRDCAFDMLVVYEDASREERLAQNLCRTRQVAFDGKNRTYPQIPTSEPRDIVVINQTPRAIQQIFISSADSSEWGEDILTHAITVGERGTVTIRADCTVDMRVVFENRAAEERRGIDLCRNRVLSIEPGWTTADELPAPPG